jgi:hypothetical protein
MKKGRGALAAASWPEILVFVVATVTYQDTRAYNQPLGG